MLHIAGLLASAFFFKRDTASLNTPQMLFTTIAQDIANRHPVIAAYINSALEDDLALASASLARQFDAFILGPLSHCKVDRPIVVVIDALDESICDDTDTTLLEILGTKSADLPPNVRIMITARQTSNMEQFLSQNHVQSYLLDIDSKETKKDITAYVDVHFRNEAMCRKMENDWPDEALIRGLKIMAGGHFIWIATVAAYLKRTYSPHTELIALLSESYPQSALGVTKKMDTLYTTILDACGDWENAGFRRDYRCIMGAIIAAKRPLSSVALQALHANVPGVSAKNLLKRFGSVLVGFHDDHEPIRLLHLSFRDFITGRAADTPPTRKFFLSETEHSQRLAELCLKTMLDEFKATIIPGTGYLARSLDDPHGIPDVTKVSEQVLYGCESWSSHISDVRAPSIAFMDYLSDFLQNCSIIWIEIVASCSVFRGSLAVLRWLKVSMCANQMFQEADRELQTHRPNLRRLYKDESQASVLFDLSNRLSYAGRYEEALTAIGESVGLRRALVAKRKPWFGKRSPTLNAHLAQSLNTLSTCLSSLGRMEDALMAVQESLALYRPLTAEQPTAFNAELANSLHSLFFCLENLGKQEEALTAIGEAVVLRRALAMEHPETHNADLARSLNGLYICFSDINLREKALAAIQEAVALRRVLAAERPTEFNVGFASSLTNLFCCLSDLGRREEALAVIQDAVKLYRALATERPAVCTAGLTISLNNQSNCLAEFGRREEALSVIREVVALRQELASNRPAAFNADLAIALNNLSRRLSDLGQHAEALAVVEEAVDMFRTLVQGRPAAFSADLARSLIDQSSYLLCLNQDDEAFSAIEKAVNIYKDLAAKRPGVHNSSLQFASEQLSYCRMKRDASRRQKLCYISV
ncbi:hypothetical protein HWV62_39249 [Athelia sp. TMB]|nr:hypothetical protein HWV62_39249 [Athelia sp. TMB]